MLESVCKNLFGNSTRASDGAEQRQDLLSPARLYADNELHSLDGASSEYQVSSEHPSERISRLLIDAHPIFFQSDDYSNSDTSVANYQQLSKHASMPVQGIAFDNEGDTDIYREEFDHVRATPHSRPPSATRSTAALSGALEVSPNRC